MNEKRIGHWQKNVQRALGEYSNNEPFARFLSKFYRSNKHMGSSDRRMTSRLCYNLFRLGTAFSSYTLQERLIIAEFLCTSSSEIVSLYNPDLNRDIGLDLNEKIRMIESTYSEFLQHVFPFQQELSPSVSMSSFARSLFVQPDLFIRVKRGALPSVVEGLIAQNIAFSQVSERCISLPNGTSLQSLTGLHDYFEVQDLSSQATEEFIEVKKGDKWWDCCAASGGKSLMLLDKCPDIHLLVSDVRMSILRNLDERFEQAKISTPYRKKILDLSHPVDTAMAGESFDGILVDAPCTGSGTWGRTPEMLGQFDRSDIRAYTQRQKQILRHVLPFLRRGGQMTYITCSVFHAENEAIVEYAQQELGLKLLLQKSIVGHENRADSMFVARLLKS